MFATRRPSLISQNLWSQNAFSMNGNHAMAKTSCDEDVEMHEDTEPVQFCNLKENILRLEELARQNGISLDDDRIDDTGRNFYQEFRDTRPSVNMFARRDSLGTTSLWFNAGRRFSGLKPEHLPEENRLAQLVCQFGLENVRELPNIPTEVIKCLLAV